MDGSSPKKSSSFETLVIQNISNLNDLKNKLNEIIVAGKSYEYDVSSCLKTLLTSDDQKIVLLTIQAISEIVKCELKRETYSTAAIIEPILSILKRDITIENSEIIKQCLRALGNLCCDCDSSRNIIFESQGIKILCNVLKTAIDNSKLTQIKLLTCKTLLNYAIGGQKFSDTLVKEDLVEILRKILTVESFKDCMDDELVTTVLLLLSVTNDNDPEIMYEDDVNRAVLKVLEEATSVEVSELCLELLHSQAEHDSVKTLLAKEGGVQLVSLRLEQLIQRMDLNNINTDTVEIEAVMKQACDLIIIILTGDEAMHVLYNKGSGEVYQTMVKWMDSSNHQLLITSILAIGNFARQDDYCIQLMDNKIFDKLLHIFVTYNGLSLSMNEGSGEELIAGVNEATANKIEHAALSALRNLSVPARNKRPASAAAPALMAALPSVRDHQVAYKLLAALRMLLDEESASVVCGDEQCVRAAARWGCAPHARACAEAARLLARAVRLLPPRRRARLAHVEGCVTSLVNMVVAPHSLMQTEAILALTLLVADCDDDERDRLMVPQLIKSEVGKHLSVLIETNCSKMPVEVAENLLAFLDLTSVHNSIVLEYRDTKVHESLRKLIDSRDDFSQKLKACYEKIISIVAETHN